MNLEFSSYFEPRCRWGYRPIKRCHYADYISLWPKWLGNENLEKLDKVSKKDWAKFNNFIISLSKSYGLFAEDHKSRNLVPISDPSIHLSGFRDSQRKASGEFSAFVVPGLQVVLEESWDFTWLVHYKQKQSLDTISQAAKSAGLYTFHDQFLRSKRSLPAGLRFSGRY